MSKNSLSTKSKSIKSKTLEMMSKIHYTKIYAIRTNVHDVLLCNPDKRT